MDGFNKLLLARFVCLFKKIKHFKLTKTLEIIRIYCLKLAFK